jgi:Vacuolar protein sorting 55
LASFLCQLLESCGSKRWSGESLSQSADGNLLTCYRWMEAGKFLTGFSAVGLIAIPAILAHAGYITVGAAHISPRQHVPGPACAQPHTMLSCICRSYDLFQWHRMAQCSSLPDLHNYMMTQFCDTRATISVRVRMLTRASATGAMLMEICAAASIFAMVAVYDYTSHDQRYY